MKEALKISVSGVRGVVGDSFTPQLAAAFAQAFGTFVGHGSVVVGRDTRPSGRMIECAVVAGLQSVGCKPILVGIAPTPTMLILVRQLGARGGIVITASHNPAPWNALKFIDRQGLFLDAVRADELFDIYHQQDFPLVQETQIPALATEKNPMATHVERIEAYVDCEAIRKRKFKVAVDCCNGVGAVYSADFLRDVFDCEVLPLHAEPSGIFERDPEPLPEHLGALCDLVTRERCDIGFAQDPDGDRLALVTEKGEALGEELTLAFAVQQVLSRHEKGPVVINLSTGKSVDYVAKQFGCEVIRTRIGETHVADAMLKAGAVVGGENTGGVMIPPIHPCRDSFAAMAVMLELLAHSGKTLSQLRAAIPAFVSVRDKVPIRSERAPDILRALRRHYAGNKMNFLDGVFIDFDHSWVHVRRSNTESVIRITSEASTREQAEQLLEELRSKVQEWGV